MKLERVIRIKTALNASLHLSLLKLMLHSSLVQFQIATFFFLQTTLDCSGSNLIIFRTG